MDYKIRELKDSDINYLQYLQPEGWQDIIYFFQYYINNNCCYPICAIDNKMIIAVGNAINNGKTGWLSHIIVHEEYRNRGIGYAITKKLIDYLFNKVK